MLQSADFVEHALYAVALVTVSGADPGRVLKGPSNVVKRTQRRGCYPSDHATQQIRRVRQVPSTIDDEPLRFGHFEIRPAERLLRVDGKDADVGARAFDLLLALAQRRGRLITKDELLALVWPGVVVEEHNIATQVSNLRKLLGSHVIATVPGRGYRFTAPPADGAGRAV